MKKTFFLAGIFVLFFYVDTIWSLDFAKINKIFEQHNYNYDYDALEEANSEVKAFLKSGESAGVDIKKYLPFIEVIHSDDGRLTVFFGDDMMGGTMRYINTLIRYIPLNSAPKTVQFSELFSKSSGAWISKIYNLNQNVYLFVGGNKWSSKEFSNEYFTITVKNNKVIPYKAFNGKAALYEGFNIFEAHEHTSNNLPEIIEIFVNSQKLLFAFDGTRYNGDYRRYGQR